MTRGEAEGLIMDYITFENLERAATVVMQAYGKGVDEGRARLTEQIADWLQDQGSKLVLQDDFVQGKLYLEVALQVRQGARRI